MTVRRLFVILFILVLFYKPVRPTLDPDMGWHLQTGEYILTHGLPRHDVFSFTVRDREWITHEWLSQVFMALVYRLGAFPALILSFAGIIALTFWLVYARCDGRPYLAAFATLLGAITSAITWGARPQMFNMLMLAVMVYIVEGVKENKLGRRWFITLPVFTAIWANLHSGYLLGVVLLAVYTAGEAMQRRFGPPDDRNLEWRDIRWLAAVTVLSFVAAIFNPSGYRLWIYPFETLTSNAMQTFIEEWNSPNFHDPGLWPFGIAWIVGATAMIFSSKRPTWTELALFLGSGTAGLISARHIQIFAIVTVPIISRHALTLFANTRFYSLLTGEQPPPKPTRTLIIFHWLILVVLALAAALHIGRTIGQNEAHMAASFPVKAVDWIEAQGWQERRVFNNYNWGGYLVWRGLPVFIDGRADVYGDDFILDYLDTIFVRPNWRETLDTYDVEYVLISPGTPLSTLLTASGEWESVYQDNVAQILVPLPR